MTDSFRIRRPPFALPPPPLLATLYTPPPLSSPSSLFRLLQFLVLTSLNAVHGFSLAHGLIGLPVDPLVRGGAGLPNVDNSYPATPSRWGEEMYTSTRCPFLVDL